MSNQFKTMATPVQQMMAICNATLQEMAAFELTERLNALSNYAELTSRDIKAIAEKRERRSLANGRVLMSAKTIKNMQALCHWACEEAQQQTPLNAPDFTAKVGS